MLNKSKLVKMEIYNLGCIGPEGLIIELDDMLCLVGPNNTGKSTVLRAYELAVGNQALLEEDRCKRCNGNDAPRVVLYVHIPENMANIDEKWKFKENDYLLVKSKWEWDASGKISRQTWSPEIDNYSTDDKASGLDTVFSSRLPIPFRIGALEEPKDEHKKLLTLVLQPIAEKIKKTMADESSELAKAIQGISSLANSPIQDEQEIIDKLKIGINKSHNEIFPNLKIDFDIGIGKIKIDPVALLQSNSTLKFYEWSDEIKWDKQGTGSQRALFWAMMQVRSELKAISDINQKNVKQIIEKEKAIQKLLKEAENAKKEETKQSKLKEADMIKQEIEKLKASKSEELIKLQRSEFSLPGYMLLIDEPEIALHPNAVRAASKYLYGIAKDESWQVMLTTHSPQFINPLEDHTTIVRLERNDKYPTPKTFRSDSISFDDEEKENLKLLNRFDVNLAEMFFGQYPIIVEGDTEFAAFEYIINNYQDDFNISTRPVVVRAHGKYTIASIIKILNHFKVGFSVLHDVDYPYRTDGKHNNAWTANEIIFKEINKARENGLKVYHRVSLPCFEIMHSGVTCDENGSIIDSDSKEKPWKMLSSLKNSQEAMTSAKNLLTELIKCDGEENPYGDNILATFEKQLIEWAGKYGIKDKRIFK